MELQRIHNAVLLMLIATPTGFTRSIATISA
jgi:hypothetical protein